MSKNVEFPQKAGTFCGNSLKIAYDEAVAVMSAVKVVDGYANGSFNPQATLTRGAAAKVICNLILGPTTASALTANQAPYKDVPANHTFAGYIAFCKEQGIISGYADGSFRPAATLTSYAFMKMLLGALGYDAEVEHYVGSNWSIQVAKRALSQGLKLNKGLEGNFVGTKPVTREEACLYAFNTLQADMVEYDTTIQIGNITVAGSKAEVCAQGAYKNTMNKNGLQFAEKYFTNLKKIDDHDSFMRPATTWKVKNDTIGTYADTADLSYTSTVKGGDIYNDLGSKVYNKNLTVYVDGEQIKNADFAKFAIVKGNDEEIGGNGTLTEVYYDHDTESAVIVMVNTYVGEVFGTHKATSKADAYINIQDLSDVAPGTKMIYTTDEKFENDTKVLYTYSLADNEIQSVVEAESVTGKVTEVRFDKDNKQTVTGMTINGEKYETSSWVFDSDNVDRDAAKAEYTIYLDGNGYIVLAEKVDELSNDYALVLSSKRDQTSNKPGTGSLTDDLRVKLVFADGTVKVVNTDKKSLDDLKKNDTGIVSYREESDGTYTLRAVKMDGKYSNDTKFELESGRAGIHVASDDSRFYGNSSSVFVIYNNKNDSWDAYTGIKSVPSVKAAGGKNVTSYTYAKADKYVKIMFIVPDDDTLVESKASSELFIVPDSASKLINDGDSAYYVYNAIVNGEIKTVKVDETEGDVGGFYKNYSIDKYDVYSNLTKASNTTDYTYEKVTGLDKTKADYTVTLGKNVYTVADKATFFYVDENHDVFESSYKSVVADENDVVYYVLKDNQIVFMVTIFVEDANGNTGDQDQKPGKTEIRYVGVDVARKQVILNKNDEPKEWNSEVKDAVEEAVNVALYEAGWMTTGKMTWNPGEVMAVNMKSAQSTPIQFSVIWG